MRVKLLTGWTKDKWTNERHRTNDCKRNWRIVTQTTGCLYNQLVQPVLRLTILQVDLLGFRPLAIVECDFDSTFS